MAFGNGPRIVTNGLTLCLDASDRNSYPGSGTTWFDVSGKNNDSSLTNGPTYSSDNNGTIVLDGTNDIIYAPSCNALGGLQNQTFEIWVKSSGLGPGKYVGGLICPDYGQISYIGADGNITYYIYNTDAGYPGTYTLSIGTAGVNCFDNQWHHVVCTRQELGTGEIYVDGQLRASSGNTGTWSGATIWSSMSTQIGNNPNDVYYNLLGSIAMARIYKKYFTQADVLQNYNTTKSRFNLK
jgi:hypothetical protein